jgi:2,3-diketo-5-methylthiopentyl-1-phosphate enolase
VTETSAFALPESVVGGDMVVATYLHRAGAATDIDERARFIAEMQSTGTWTQLAQETDAVRERHGARVISLTEIPDDEAAEAVTPGPSQGGTRTWIFQIAFPSHNIGGQMPILLATVFGECASIGDLRLLDIQFPESFVASFRGPKFGIDGIRKLVGVTDRPLLIALIKPSIGLGPAESAEVFRQAALGGADGVKDDEKVVSHPWSNFVDRVRLHERAAHEVFEETGHRTLFFVNITDRPDRLVQNAYRAIEAGASALMVDHLAVGTPALSMLADDPAIAVPIMGHLAFSGAMTASPWTGVSSHLVLGKLPRLAGADVVIYPSPYGTLSFGRSTHLRVARSLTEPLFGLRRALPAPGAGLHAGMVPRLVADLGIDWALPAGGSIHGHPDGAAAGAKALRVALDATARGELLSITRMTSPELDVALERWPELGPAEPEGRASLIEEGVRA